MIMRKFLWWCIKHLLKSVCDYIKGEKEAAKQERRKPLCGLVGKRMFKTLPPWRLLQLGQAGMMEQTKE